MKDQICCLILNYNDYMETVGCVDHLIQLDGDGKLQIVVVDNNSTNDSYERLKDKYNNNSRITLIQSATNGGYSAGNNIGFKYIAKNFPNIKFTILMNPDTRLYSMEDVKKMEMVLMHDATLAIVAPIVILNGEVNYKNTAWNAPTTSQILRLHCKFLKYSTKQYVNEASNGIVYVDAVQGGFFAIRMKALVDIGFLDESIFLYSEEVLLSRDLSAAGYREAVLTDVFFDHNHKNYEKKTKLSIRFNQEKNAYKSRKVYSKKYLGKTACWLLKVVHVANNIYIIITHPIIKLIIERKDQK